MSILGVDLSNHNANRGPVNFDELKAAGCGFAWLKATEGVDFVDPSVHAFAAGCVAAELPFAYYHFATPGGSRVPGGYKKWWDAQDEANDFLAALETLPPAPCFPILDFEWSGMDECLPDPRERARWCREWIAIVHAAHASSGATDRARRALELDPSDEGARDAIERANARAGVPSYVQFYSNPNYLYAVTLPDPVINLCPLWYARWTSPPPPFDPAWGWEKWDIWQYTDKGEIDGVTGRVDLNTCESLEPVTFDRRPPQLSPSQRIKRSVRKIRRQCDELALVAAELERGGF